MWIAGIVATLFGTGMVGYGSMLALKGTQGARARWSLGRGSVVLVLGILAFVGVPMDGVGFQTMAMLLVAASSVAVLVILSLSEETVEEGRAMTTFRTRPARSHRALPEPTPVPSSNRPAALHPAMAHGDDPRLEETV